MSDEYNFDDFEDFDSEQKETAKANGKSAKSYARNVLKSAKYIGLDVIKNFDPDIRDFLSDTSSIFTDMYDVVENAKRVIRGDFGNGQERKDKLGSAYAEIQSKVNEMYRQGLVY